MSNPHYGEGGIAPPSRAISPPEGEEAVDDMDVCRQCFADVRLDTDGHGALVVLGMDGSLHMCEGA